MKPMPSKMIITDNACVLTWSWSVLHKNKGKSIKDNPVEVRQSFFIRTFMLVCYEKLLRD